MADEPSPAEEARLRRLLARSRHDEQVPPDVAARLDDVLGRLERGEETAAAPAVVHELAARRRRTAVSVLVAAAAVVVLGVGLGQVVDDLGTASQEDATASREIAADRSQGRSGDLSGAGSAAEAPAEAPAEDGVEDDLESGLAQLDSGSGYSSTPLGAQVALGDLLLVGGRLTVVPDEGFTRTAERLQHRVEPALRRGRRAAATLGSAPVRVRRQWQGCAPVDFGDGTAVAVLYDGGPAILVFRPFSGDSQVVELLQCGTGSSMRSVTLPVP